MNFTAAVLRRPVAITVLTIAVAVVGLFALERLDVDYLPDITYPMIKIHIWWRGATPDDVETNLAEPIEQVMATVDNVDYLESSSIEGMYTLLVNFQYGTDVDTAYEDVMAAMGRVARRLPPDIDPPVVIKADPSQLPVMEVAISSDVHSLVWLRDWAENWLTDRLTAVPGTAGVEIVGGLEREIRVHLDPQRMTAYGLTPARIAKALSEENRQMFAGRVTVETREIIARTMGEFENLDEIRNVVVALGANGEKVYLKDVASVEDAHEEMRINTRFNGKPCVKLNVLKQAQANTVSVANAVKRRIAELRPEIPGDIEFGFVENQGDYVMGAIRSVESSAVLSAVLVIVVIYFFIGRLRQVVVMMIALPVTLLANFFFMKVAGFSLNIFSLGGLVVALGVILDNSIVVMENITRLKAEGHEDYALRGTSEVASAILASTLTFLAIFVPFLLVPGLASLLFKELVLVVAGVVLISLLIAMTLTPLLTDRLLRRESRGGVRGVARLFDAMVGASTRVYAWALGRCLRARWLVVAAVLCVFALSAFLAVRVGSEFLPALDDGRVMVKVKMPAGTSVAETDRILAQIEKQLTGLPEIESVFTLAGGKVWGLATYEIANEGEVDIQLVPKSRRNISTQAFVEKIRPLVAKVPAPGGKLPVMQMKVKGIRQIGEQQVEVEVRGDEVEPIYEFAKKVAARLSETPGLANVNISMDMTKPEYRVYVDRARASALGISVNQVAATLRTLVAGIVSTQYREGSQYYDIRTMVPEVRLASKSDLENLVLDSIGGRPVYLRDVAEVRRAVGPIEIVRKDQIKQVVVRADSAGISVGEAVARAERVTASLERPAGVTFAMGGQAQMMAENRRTMGFIIAFAVLFAFVVLAIQFESFSLPFLIVVDIPLALTGAFIALYLAQIPIGVTVLIGMVVMMGGIVSQGVVLLTLAEEYRMAGATPVEAMLRAGPIRLRPILMTQLTTVLGVLPLALNLGEGGDMLMPMAVAVIGGLVYSLFLTLFFLPAAYTAMRRTGGRTDGQGSPQDEERKYVTTT